MTSNLMSTLRSVAIGGALLILLPGTAAAQKFNSLIPNPFVFCSAPKPCKLCQPWRRIWQEICSDQPNAGSGTQQEMPSIATPIVESIDRYGRKSYSRTVDGWTIRSPNRMDIDDAHLNDELSSDAVEVVGGPSIEVQR